MFWVHLDDLSDEENGLERSEGRLAFKFEERLHQWTQNHGDCLRIGLSDLVDRFDQQVAVFISNGSLRAVFLHFAGPSYLSLQEDDHLFDVARTDQVGDEFKHFLVDLQGDGCLVFDEAQDVGDVVFKNFRVLLPQLQELVENDHLHVVVVILLKQVQIALNSDLDG